METSFFAHPLAITDPPSFVDWKMKRKMEALPTQFQAQKDVGGAVEAKGR